MSVETVEGVSYYINNQLRDKWDKIKDGKLKKQDNDKVYIVDGRERTGKSTFAMQQACYIDPTLVHDISRICFSADEFLEAIRKTDSDEKVTKCIIFDEAFRGLASRAAMSKTNKMIVQALMEVGQKNLVIWIVLPSFFMLDLYVAMLRSNTLFHLSTDKRTNRRVYYVYPYKKKGLLYQNGVRKGWSYDTTTKNKGNFFDNFPNVKAAKEKELDNTIVKDFYKAYLKKKRESLVESENSIEIKEENNKYRDFIMNKCYKLVQIDKLSLREAEKVLKDDGIEISFVTIGEFAKKVESNIVMKQFKQHFLSENMEKMLNVRM